MNRSAGAPSLFPILRNSPTWDEHFTVRQVQFYHAENKRVEDLDPFPAEKPRLKAFLAALTTALDPPECNFVRLTAFLNEADERDLEIPTHAAALRQVALLDDRRDPFGLRPRVQGHPLESNGEKRQWDADTYYREPTPGENIWRNALDERALYRRLAENVSESTLTCWKRETNLRPYRGRRTTRRGGRCKKICRSSE